MMKLAIITLLLLVTCAIAAILHLESAVKQLENEVKHLHAHYYELSEVVCAIDERLCDCDDTVNKIVDPEAAVEEEEEVPVESTEE